MLERDPSRRYGRIADLRRDLARLDFLDLNLQEPSWAINAANDSFDRCRLSPKFFHDFYETLFRGHDEIKNMFRHDGFDLVQQYWLLREAIDLLLQFPLEPPGGVTILGRVATSHRKLMMTPAAYDRFVDTLMETVRRHDQYWGDDEGRKKDNEDAWRMALREGIAYLKDHSSRPATSPDELLASKATTSE